MNHIKAIKKKIARGERLTSADGSFLMEQAELLELAPLASTVREKLNMGRLVTYVVDTNLNYTNICDAYCSFCAFYRTDPEDPSAYTYSVEEIMEKITQSDAIGVTTVLMQGGLNNTLPLSYYTKMVFECRRRFPNVTPHFWSAPEISKMAQVSNLTITEVLQALWDAGQRTIPGGGSEILSNRVKQQVSRFAPKDTWEEWAFVHKTAHEIGFLTTATMMYGHLENNEDIVETLIHIRDVQDQASSFPGGFTAFIPWSYKRSNTALAKKVAAEAGPNRYLRIIAVSRLLLDNVQHIQASWFSEGKKTGQIALHFGADDFGGTLFDENVMLAAGFYNRTTERDLRDLIWDSGFIPAQRRTNYDIERVFVAPPQEPATV